MLGPILLRLNQSATVYVPADKVGITVQPHEAEVSSVERLTGPQAAQDTNTYRVWHKTGLDGGPPGKYLVDSSDKPVWLVDPGINGNFATRPDGSSVRKFEAPKATLVSYIIRGILDRQLPWGLVLFGVMIAVVLEMSGIPSLAFAVGVYLPLSASTPIFVGGMLRWLIDRRRWHKLRDSGLDESQIAAEGDKSPGVLMASGYIAGGAIAGIIIALMAGVFDHVDSYFTNMSGKHNPFFVGPWSDALSLLPFVVLCAILYWSGHEAKTNGRTS